MERKGAKIVAAAVLGYDFRRVIVNGRDYEIHPPTIHRICGAAYWLSDAGDADTMRGLLLTMERLDRAAKALSFFIAGDESLAEELSQGTMGEVVDALEAAFSLMDARDFTRLSALTKSAERLTARPR